MTEAKIRKVSKKDLLKWTRPKPGANVHLVWHDFLNTFMDKKTWSKWKCIGYKLMRKVEKWAKKWPNDVQIVQCDDNVHASSDLILIKHRALKTGKYFGTSIVFIPQCTGENPIKFFLYPSRHDELIKALTNTKNEHQKHWDTF